MTLSHTNAPLYDIIRAEQRFNNTNKGVIIMKELVINKENFENEVVNSDKPVLLDFWAEWCGPCRMLSPVVSEIAEKYDGKIKVGKVNVDNEIELASAFQISSIPALSVVKDGRVVNSAVGFRNIEQIEAMINE